MTDSDRQQSPRAPGILIVGASARAAAQSAARGGFRVCAADLFADRDLREVANCLRVRRYPADFTRVRQAWATLPLVYTGALENYPELLAAWSNDGIFWGNGADIVRAVRDPFRLHETLVGCGVVND